MKIDINLNDMCEVVLTEHGANVWNDQFLEAKVAPTLRLQKGAALRVPLWELMAVFGKLMHNGQLPLRLPFVDNRVTLADRQIAFKP